MARVLPMLGRAAEAIAPAERAVVLFGNGQGDPLYLNEARFFLASALWDGGGTAPAPASSRAKPAPGSRRRGPRMTSTAARAWLRKRGLTW